MFHIDYNEVLAILASMERTLGEVDDCIDEFDNATRAYNATMQDDVAKEATNIVRTLREDIQRMRELIEDSNKKVEQGARGLKQIEENAKNGGLRV